MTDQSDLVELSGKDISSSSKCIFHPIAMQVTDSSKGLDQSSAAKLGEKPGDTGGCDGEDWGGVASTWED